MKKFGKTNLQYAVLGLGRWGSSLVRQLNLRNCEVLAVDNQPEKVNEIGDFCTHAVVGDVADEAVLTTLGIDSFDAVIIAIGDNMQASIICALTCKELGAKYVIAKANNEKHAKILEKIGVDKIIIPEDDSATKTANILLNPHVNELLESAEGYSMAEITVPESWHGKKLAELGFRQKYNVNVLLLVDKNGKNIIPYPDTVFNASDLVTIGGLADDVKKFINKL